MLNAIILSQVDWLCLVKRIIVNYLLLKKFAKFISLTKKMSISSRFSADFWTRLIFFYDRQVGLTLLRSMAIWPKWRVCCAVTPTSISLIRYILSTQPLLCIAVKFASMSESIPLNDRPCDLNKCPPFRRGKTTRAHDIFYMLCTYCLYRTAGQLSWALPIAVTWKSLSCFWRKEQERMRSTMWVVCPILSWNIILM